MIIVISGLPGSGKSYFASRLAARINALCFNSEQIRTEHDLKGKYTFKERLSIYLYIADQAGKALEKGRDVVVDATFYHHTMRDLFIELAAMHHTPLYIILIEAAEELIKERLTKAGEFSEVDFGSYQSLKPLFEKINMPHLRLISNNHNIEQMLDTATTFLLKTHDKF